MIELGCKGKDKITGFEGIIISHVKYLYGCNQYGITGPMLEGKPGKTEYFDEGRVEVTGPGISAESVQVEEPGGPNRDAPPV